MPQIRAFLLPFLSLLLFTNGCFAQKDSTSLMAQLSESFELINDHPDSARGIALEVMRQAKESKYPTVEAASLRKLAIIQKNWGDYELSMAHSLASLKMCDSIGDLQGMASSYSQLAVLRARQKDRHSAIEYHRKALRIRLDREELDKVSGLYVNLGSNFKNLGQLDSAWHYYKSALQLIQNHGFRDQLIGCLINVGNLHIREDKVDLAIASFRRALRLAGEEQDSVNIAKALGNLGALYLQTGILDSAELYLESAISINKRLSAAQSLTDNLYNLVVVHDEQGRIDSAYSALWRYVTASEDYFDADREKRIRSIEARYQVEKKERENTELRASNAELDAAQQRQSMWILGLVLGMLILMVAGAFAIYHQRQRAQMAHKNEQIKQQKINELLQKQELAALDAMVQGQEKERRRIAEDLHDRIGSQLATVKHNMEALEGKVDKGQAANQKQFSKTYTMLDHLVDEVRKLSHDMVSGVLMKFGLEEAVRELGDRISSSDKIQVSVFAHNLDQRVPSKVEIAVYRITQELLANVLKHAQASEVTISMNRQEDHLNVIVEDDGQGFETGQVKEGMGLENVQKRAALLNGTVIFDSNNGRGTTVIIDIPLL